MISFLSHRSTREEPPSTSRNMSGPSWLGLLKWSLQQQDVAPSEGVHEMSEEDRQ